VGFIREYTECNPLEETIMATDGISRLINVSQQKSANANEEATSAAEKQTTLIGEQKSVRSAQSNFDALVRDSSPAGADPLATKASHKATTASAASIAAPSTYFDRLAKSDSATSSLFSPAGLAKSLDAVASNVTRYASGIHAFVEALKKRLEESNKDLESKDKLGNFEIQDLMSSFNQAETLASSVKKKQDDQNASVISKI